MILRFAPLSNAATLRLILLCFILCLSSCAGKAFLDQELKGAVPLSPQERNAFFKDLRQFHDRFTGIRALYDARIREKEAVTPLRYGVVFKAPGELRIDFLPPQAAHSLGLLTVSQGNSLFLDTQAKKAFRGSPGKSLVRYVLKLPLNEDELAGYLFGRIPGRLLIEETAIRLRTLATQDGESIIVHDKESDSIWSFSRSEHLLTSASLRSIFDSSERLRYTAEWQKKTDSASPQDIVPHAVTFGMPRFDVEILLTLTRLKLDSELPAALFNVEIPSGYREVESPLLEND